MQKNVLITGASQRIGRVIALDLAALGYGVGVHYLSSKGPADEVVQTIVAAGGRAVAVQADLSVEAQVKTIFPTLTAALGPVDVLINNASLFENDTAATTSRESWDSHMEVNLRAPFVLSQMFHDQLPADARGNIINILDQRVWNLTPFFMSYTVSKTALWTLTQTLALGLAPRIRVNGIGPGPTLKNQRQSDDSFNRQCAETPLGEAVDPQDIAAGVRFILDTSSMTGQMIALDSGQHMGWGQMSNQTIQTE